MKLPMCSFLLMMTHRNPFLGMTEKKRVLSHVSSFLCGKAHTWTTAVFKTWQVNWTPGSGNSGGHSALQVNQRKPPLPDCPSRGSSLVVSGSVSPVPLPVSAPRWGDSGWWQTSCGCCSHSLNVKLLHGWRNLVLTTSPGEALSWSAVLPWKQTCKNCGLMIYFGVLCNLWEREIGGRMDILQGIKSYLKKVNMRGQF